MSLVYIDGEFYPKDQAKVSVFDHGFLYGDGVFEGIRAYNGRVFKLDEHVDRLFECCRVIKLDPGVSKSGLKDIILRTCAKNNVRDGYIRPIVSRGVGDLGLNPYLCKKASIVCIAGTISLYPQKYYEEGLKIITAATHRNHPEALNPRVKSLNYLNNIMAKIEAIQAGAVEAIMLNTLGFVAECTGDNIFIMRRGKLHTPDVYSGALDGITAQTVKDLARARGIEVVEGQMSRFDIYTADECFLTGTAAELIPVVEVDTRPIGDGKVGPVFQKLLVDFRNYANNNGSPIPEQV